MSRPNNRKQASSSIAYLGVGLLATVLLMGGTMAVERTSPGHRVELLTLEFLHSQLKTFDPDESPVVVVDISKVPGGKAGEPTKTSQLTEIIGEIARHSPKAIALDIDFSPGEAGWQRDDDPKFFDDCLKTENDRSVPIYLGIAKTIGAPADGWLGLEKYERLAAATIAPMEDQSRIPSWVQAKGVSDRLPTLSGALARAYKKPLPAPPKLLEWLVEDNSKVSVERLSVPELEWNTPLVNYSKLEAIEHEAISTISAASVRDLAGRFNGKLVVLGDATDALDQFDIPGRSRPVPGVYLQACSIYTLVKEPLYEFRPWVRIAFDLLLSLSIILVVALLRARGLGKSEKTWHKRQARVIYLAVVIVFFTGILLVRLLDVMWLDFFLVSFALLLHPSVEGKFNTLLEKWTTRRGGRTPPKRA